MKIMKSLLALLALCLLVCNANAQGGLDVFGNTRTLIVDTPRLISGGGNNSTTTAAVDIHIFQGRAKVDVFSKTNTGNSATMVVTPQTSPDQVTWTTVQNYAVASSATVIYTNLFYGTNGFYTTNTYNFPGVIVTPTAATAGFASPYLDPTGTPYTNTSTFTISADGVYTIAFVPDDQQRYFRLKYVPGGNATNSNLGAILTGRIPF